MPYPVAAVRGKISPGDQYVTLPQNLLLSPGTLWEDFENDADWTAANGSVSDDAVNYKTGTQSVKLTANSGATATMTKTVAWDLSGDWNGLSFWMYMPDVIADYGTKWMRIDLSNDSAFTNYMRHYYDTNLYTFTAGQWFRVYIPKAYFAAVAAGTFANPIIRIKLYVYAAAGKTPSVSFDDLEIGEKHVPAIMLRFDDASDDHYSIVYQYMKSWNLRATDYIVTSWLDTPTFLTSVQAMEMYAAGWSMANHTRAHTPLKGIGVAAQQTAIGNCITDLTALGMARDSIYLAYPGGGAAPGYDADTFTAMNNLGVKTGQATHQVFGTTAGTVSFVPQILPDNWTNDQFHVRNQSFSTVSTVTQLLTMIDKTITSGGILSPLIHRLNDAGQLTTAEFQTIADYIRVKAKAGLIYPITINDYYKLTLGPVSVPKVT
jgi:hypothetical protein